MPKKTKERLDRKRHNKTITSDDLPKRLRDRFPGELAHLTLEEIERLCRKPFPT